MKEKDLIKFVETSARLESICDLLEEPGRLPADQRQMWINNYNHIARKAGLADYYDFEFDNYKKDNEKFEDSYGKEDFWDTK